MQFKQSDFDRFMLACWRDNHRCGYVFSIFIERHGLPAPESFEAGFEILKAGGLERIPTKSYWVNGVGSWLNDAYPQFLDAITRSGDASKIKLDWLIFKDPGKHKQDSSLKPARYSQMKYAATRFGDLVAVEKVKGSLINPKRVKCPQGKRKN